MPQALEQGLRPGRSDIGIRDYAVPANLLLKLRHFGAAVEPRQHNPPILGPAEVQALQRLWEDATGMN